jgi:hypothetical protein
VPLRDWIPGWKIQPNSLPFDRIQGVVTRVQGTSPLNPPLPQNPTLPPVVIVGGEVIGAHIKTATAGRRIEIGGLDYQSQIVFFGDDGNELGELRGVSVGLDRYIGLAIVDAEAFYVEGDLDVLGALKGFEAGVVNLDLAVVNSRYIAHVTFADARFAANPAVTITPETTYPQRVECSVANVDNTGFDLYARCIEPTALGTYTFHWIAVKRG